MIMIILHSSLVYRHSALHASQLLRMRQHCLSPEWKCMTCRDRESPGPLTQPRPGHSVLQGKLPQAKQQLLQGFPEPQCCSGSLYSSKTPIQSVSTKDFEGPYATHEALGVSSPPPVIAVSSRPLEEPISLLHS